MKKRILALVLSLVMALTLFGCGGNDAQQNNSRQTAANPTPAPPSAC